MGLFGPPDVPKLVEKHDLDGLIWAAHYRKSEKVRSAAKAALATFATELVQALEDLLRTERQQFGPLGKRTLRNFAQLQRLQDGLVAIGAQGLEPLLRSFAATYRGDSSTEFWAYRDVLWRLSDVDLSELVDHPDPAVRDLITDAISVRATRSGDA